jgi:selenide,water dikinase
MLVLTKPLGFGVTTTALKQQRAAAGDVAEVVDWMSRLNNTAAALAVGSGLRAATDVTGFGLLGHGLEMARASGLGLALDLERLPWVAGAGKYARLGIFPGGAFDNRAYFGPDVRWEAAAEEPEQMLLFDPQTSGGLLLGVPPDRLDGFLSRAAEDDQPAWVIGRAEAGSGIRVMRGA